MGFVFVKNIFRKYPRLANSATYGFLYVGAEYSQQFITNKLLAKQEDKKSIDYKALGRYFVVGSLINSNYLYSWVLSGNWVWPESFFIIGISGSCHGSAKIILKAASFGLSLYISAFGFFPILWVMGYFFRYKWLDGKFVGTCRRVVIKKVLLDQFVMTPPLYIIFYVSMSVLEGKEKLLDECKAKFVPTFLVSCIFWLPVQTINFIYLPNAARIVYMGLCSFAWMNVLCWIKAKEGKL